MDGYLQRKKALMDLNKGRIEKYGNNPKWIVSYVNLTCDCEIIIAHNDFIKSSPNPIPP